MPIYRIVIERQEFEITADDEADAEYEAKDMVEIDSIEYVGEE